MKKVGVIDRNGYRQTTTYHGSNRWQEIKYAINHEWGSGNEPSPYVRYGNQRYWLDEFMRPSPGIQEDFKHDLGFKIDGYASLTMETGMIIVLNRDGDKAKLFYFWSSTTFIPTKGEN